MKVLAGYVDRIVYRNEENGYTVLILTEGKSEITCVGTFYYINEGEYIEVTGTETYHQMYGKQIQVESYEVKTPTDALSIRKYLGSGAIKGIGEALAKRIVDKFGEDTFRIVEEEPERLAEIKGISQRKAREISIQIEEQRGMRDAMIYLQQFGISTSLAVKIYSHYGDKMYNILKSNPYLLADDIDGIGFKTADEIAARAGISVDSDFRIKSGILYALLETVGNGNTCYPLEELKNKALEILEIDRDITTQIDELSLERKIRIKTKNEKQFVYGNLYYNVELSIAAKLRELNISTDYLDIVMERTVNHIEKTADMEFDQQQRKAVMEAAGSGVLIITGGPGTGKTTIINAIIKLFEMEDAKIRLAAPTGRAAKRMTEATGREAQTIHRMLELMSGISEKQNGAFFERNEDNPLDADVIIIDEMSMVDVFLMNSLLKAITPGTHLILVGDVDQLPSVGPGNVLKDMIDSGEYNTVKLTKIFRQEMESGIVVNAHKINNGEAVNLDNSKNDFLYIRRNDVESIIGASKTLMMDKLPGYVNAGMMEIQVLTPMRKGPLGVENINKVLQNYLNPKDANKGEKEYGDTVFREGDKVMQIKNNYQLEWEKRSKKGLVLDRGLGVFNGDVGIIRRINEYTSLMEIEFDDGRFVTYEFNMLDELELAYAVTIHKSQGSEYPAVILPLLKGPIRLMNRNLLYTAITRAKSCVCIVGSDETFAEMINNKQTTMRYSGLKDRILELREDLEGDI